jgi:hypothetical protein
VRAADAFGDESDGIGGEVLPVSRWRSRRARSLASESGEFGEPPTHGAAGSFSKPAPIQTERKSNAKSIAVARYLAGFAS